MNGRTNQSMIVLQRRKHFIFDIHVDYVEWNVARIIWIAFYKNRHNSNCFIGQLPKDLIKSILDLVGAVNGQMTPFVKI